MCLLYETGIGYVGTPKQPRSLIAPPRKINQKDLTFSSLHNKLLSQKNVIVTFAGELRRS